MPALDELVLTVLSQNTNDVNRDRAYNELRRRFPKWENVMAAPAKSIADAIKVGGLADIKSERIKQMLKTIQEREGQLDLSSLCRMETGEALDYLYSLKGVGEKTAACVLLFSCGKPVFPVDTHILRLSKRLAFIPARADAKTAHEIMGAHVPEELIYRFHINLIAHGRKVCHPRKPDCGGCCLKTKCPSVNKVS